MTYKLPKRTHLVHKPVEPRNLSAKFRNKNVNDGEQYVWQLKYDGCNMMVVICEGKGYAFSRTGEPVRSCDHIVRELERLPSTHAVWFGEAYNHDWEHSKINGAFRAHDPAPDLCFMVFDCVPLSCFEEGVCDVPYYSRLDWLQGNLFKYGTKHSRPVHSFSPTRLESTENLIETARKSSVFALDGYVAKRKDGHWIAGAGKGGEQVKIKDHLSLDLRCVGLVEGKGKFTGKVGAIKVEYNGQILEVGGGKMTDQERGRYWDFPNHLIGSIVEIHALAGSAHGKLREPRFIRVRPDKTEPDA